MLSFSFLSCIPSSDDLRCGIVEKPMDFPMISDISRHNVRVDEISYLF